MARRDALSTKAPRFVRHPLNGGAAPIARAGAIAGLVAVVMATLYWTGVIGGGVTSVNTASASYIAGQTYGTANFSSTTTENTVCNLSHATTIANQSQWLQGCRDSWAIAVYSSAIPNYGRGIIP